ncbi:MAG: endo-1,4-beta-xylanase [Flavisolibacter sp.]|nr:endo-1,4-beta-xylanase [Flavisolibacter sp.]
MKKGIVYKLTIAGVLFISCYNTKSSRPPASRLPSLKEIFKNDFLIGTALSAEQIEEKDSSAAVLVRQQFNAVTPENVMKAEIIHPQWEEYNFDFADKLVDYSKKYGMELTATPLIWHSQLPPFVSKLNDADSVRRYFEDHIATVAGRYDGKTHSWEVVNEALNEDGSLRNTVFLQKLGSGYVVEAFRLAQKAAPNTQLYYNDYNIEQPRKRAGAIEIVKKIQAAGVRIDGVGIQGHWHVDDVPLNYIEQSIQEFSALGLQVAFTELDLSVLPNPWGRIASADISQTAQYEAQMNPYTKGLPDSVQQKLATVYARLFLLFLKYKDNISRVTFWGVNDGQSWLNDFPIRGRTNYPLLFDRQYHPKPAFYTVIETKKKAGIVIH